MRRKIGELAVMQTGKSPPDNTTAHGILLAPWLADDTLSVSFCVLITAMKSAPAFLALVALTTLVIGPAKAQTTSSPNFGINATFARLFGAHTTFSAHADVLVAGGQKTTMPMQLAMSGSRMRMEVLLSSVRVDGQSQPGAEAMALIGLDRIITVSSLDEKTSLTIVPGLKAIVNTRMTEEEADSLSGDAKLEESEAGKEAIAGHPCMKNHFVITDKKARKRTGSVWRATDLKSFPIQIQMLEGTNQMVLRFSDIKFQTPDSKLFTEPTGYRSYDSLSDLVGEALARLQKGDKK
jgi:hypothetical protein